MGKQNLNQVRTSFLSIEANLFAVSTAKGSILAIKKSV
jgi:hypothetical protein